MPQTGRGCGTAGCARLTAGRWISSEVARCFEAADGQLVVIDQEDLPVADTGGGPWPTEGSTCTPPAAKSRTRHKRTGPPTVRRMSSSDTDSQSPFLYKYRLWGGPAHGRLVTSHTAPHLHEVYRSGDCSYWSSGGRDAEGHYLARPSYD